MVFEEGKKMGSVPLVNIGGTESRLCLLIADGRLFQFFKGSRARP